MPTCPRRDQDETFDRSRDRLETETSRPRPHPCATQFHGLIISKNRAPELHILNLAVVSLRLAWNISRMKESELSNNELLDVLSEVVLRLSGHETWNNSTTCNYRISFRECSKWYFIKGVRLLSINCGEHSAAYCLWVKTCKKYFKSALSIQDEYSASIHDACHVYLSALYYVTGANQEKMTQHITEAKNWTSSNSLSKPQILSYSSLLFVDTVAHVCGFCLLFDNVPKNKNALSENGFTLSTIVYCLKLSVLQINNRPTKSLIKINRKEMTKLEFTSRFDICLWAVSVHKYRRSTDNANRGIHKWSSTIPSNSSNNEEGMQFCLDDSLEETLVKVSVDMLQKFNELYFITLEQVWMQPHCKTVSHFKALYYYRKGEFMKLLSTCESIISQEIFISRKRRHPIFFPSLRLHDMFCVSVLFAFQTLFGNDVTCLTGLIALVDPGCYRKLNKLGLNESELKRVIKFERKYLWRGKLGRVQHIHLVARVSSFFLVRYLKFQSLIQLHSQKSDILLALNDLKHARKDLIFEDILLVFVGMTLKRLPH